MQGPTVQSNRHLVHLHLLILVPFQRGSLHKGHQTIIIVHLYSNLISLCESPSLNRIKIYYEVSRAHIGLVEGRIMMIPTRQDTLLRIVLIVLVDRIKTLMQASSTVIEVTIFYHVLKANTQTDRLLIAFHLVN